MEPELVSKLRDLAKESGSGSVLHKATSFCTRIDGEAGRDRQDFWIQLHDGTVNFKCLDDPAADDVLEELLAGRRLSEWEPAVFGMLDLSDAPDAVAEEFVSSLIRRYYGVGAFAALEFSLEEL
jgi:hypothetical protein